MITRIIMKSIFIIISAGIVFSVSAKEHVIEQHNKSFVMGDSKIEEFNIKVGDTIRFKNEDTFFHNIFSLSDLKTFDLGSFPKGQSKVVTFDKTGKVEIECAIHPQMFMELTIN